LLGDLADDRAAAELGGREPERRRDGRLSDAALAGDVDQRLVAQQGFHPPGHPMTMPVMDPALAQGHATGRRMLLRHDPTYYVAPRRLPRELRPATHALYGFVRTADQIVDGPRRAATAQERRAALDAWEAELQAGCASRVPVVRALADAGARHRLPLFE